MYRQFNIQQFYVLPTQCIYVFVWIWEQTAIISLYSINWLVFVTERKCVYCAVRAEYLNVIQINFRPRTVEKDMAALFFMLSINVLKLGEIWVNHDMPTCTHLPGLVTEFHVVSSCDQQTKRTRKEYGVVLSIITYHCIRQQAKHAYLSKCSLI